MGADAAAAAFADLVKGIVRGELRALLDTLPASTRRELQDRIDSADLDERFGLTMAPTLASAAPPTSAPPPARRGGKRRAG